MRQLAASHPGVQIAVSLNATTDEVRSQIMPVNRRWPLEALTRALREAFPADESLTARLQRRTTVFLEYIMLRVSARGYDSWQGGKAGEGSHRRSAGCHL